MPAFTMHVIRGAAVAQVIVFGEVRGPDAPKLAECLVVLAARGVLQLVVDLSAVGFMDTTGRRALLQASAQLEEGGATVVITGMHGMPRGLLANTGLAHDGRQRARLGGAVGRQRLRR